MNEKGRRFRRPIPTDDHYQQLSQVIAYAEQGWPGFLVEPGGKRPLLKAWPEKATTDKATLRQWWEQFPHANIGLITGHLFDVLDVDDLSAFNAVVPDGAPFPKGPYAITGGGGVHFFFQPSGLGNRTKFMPGADWRGKGGYVVAPPSVHESGQRYEWGRSPAVPLPAAPKWLVERLAPAVRPKRRRAVQGAITGRYGRSALRREVGMLARAEEGERNDRLNRAAFRLGQLVGSGAVDAETVTAVLSNVARDLGLGDAEATDTIASGLRAGQSAPRGVAS